MGKVGDFLVAAKRRKNREKGGKKREIRLCGMSSRSVDMGSGGWRHLEFCMLTLARKYATLRLLKMPSILNPHFVYDDSACRP